MTILAIDAGNTRIKWGVRDGAAWTQQDALPTAEAARLGEALAPARQVERAVIANVAGERVAQALSSALPPGLEPQWVVSRAEQCGVRSGYADPAQLGADRWAALIGARHLYSGPCVVVNAGTTMTVDALSAESIFLGGFIVPGYALMRDALAANTAQLALRDGAFSFFPDNTGDAIASGALNALAGAVDRMCRYVVETGEDDPMIVLSGGNAALLEPLVNGRLQLVDNLVLEGLARIGASDV
jgi:type III pantothenate kinase